jgi:predicted Fe-Mo cluster-binding NifX family protein
VKVLIPLWVSNDKEAVAPSLHEAQKFSFYEIETLERTFEIEPQKVLQQEGGLLGLIKTQEADAIVLKTAFVMLLQVLDYHEIFVFQPETLELEEALSSLKNKTMPFYPMDEAQRNSCSGGCSSCSSECAVPEKEVS